MGKNEKASPPVWTTGGRRAEKEAAEQLIPHLHCITAVGGVQAARNHDRLVLYGKAKAEFETLQMSRMEPCSYEAFTNALVEALRL